MTILMKMKTIKLITAIKYLLSIYIPLQLIGLFFSTLLLPELIRRNVKENMAPCFVLSNATNRVNESIQETLIDLIIRTEGATRIPKEIQTFLREHLLLLPEEIPRGTFLAANAIPRDRSVYPMTKSNIVKLLNTHYYLLYKLVSHVEYSRQSDKLSSGKNTQTLGDKLIFAKDEIYQIMCSIKIALIGQRAETQNIADSNLVTQEFISAGGTAYNATTRLYVLMDDFETIMDYLNKVYITMNVNLTGLGVL